MIRQVIQQHTGVAPPALPPPVPSAAYGAVELVPCSSLLGSRWLSALSKVVDLPEPMETFMQRYVLPAC